jgi:hypothetical protein
VTRRPDLPEDPPITSPGWRAWAGLFGGAAVWALHHQLGSAGNFARCSIADARVDLTVGALAMALVALSGWLSWTAWRKAGGREDASHEPAGRLLAAVSMMASALFMLAIITQMIAGLIVPACWR